MYVGRDCGAEAEQPTDFYSFLKFDLSDVAMSPDDVIRVWLRLHVFRNDEQQNGLSVYEALSAWDSGVTWDTMPRAEYNVAGRLVRVDVGAQAPGTWAEHKLDITRATARWLRNPATNYGLVLRDDAQECWMRAAIATSDHEEPGRRPGLEFQYRVDESPPSTTITSTPANPTRSADVVVSFVGADAETGVVGFECKLDSSPLWKSEQFVPCTSPAAFKGLANGLFSLAVRAVDASGNVDPNPPSVQWLVDTCPPKVTLERVHRADEGPSAAMFAFNVSDEGDCCAGQSDGGRGSGVASVSCSLDGSPYRECASPLTLAALAEGAHALRVRAADLAGNVAEGAATWRWEVRLPPRCHLAIEAGPRVVTASGQSVVKSRPFKMTVRWTKPVGGFGPADVAVGGSTGGADLIAWEANDGKTEFSATVAPVQSGQLTLQVPAGSVSDADGVAHARAPSDIIHVTYDDTPPRCTISGPTGRVEEPFHVTFTWSEPVQGFQSADVALSGAPCAVQGPLTADASGMRFTATLVPAGVGRVHVSVPANSASDFAGNANPTSNEITVNVASTRIYVAEGGSGKVLVFGHETPTLSTTAKSQVPFRQLAVVTGGGLSQPGALSVDEEGRVHVVDTGHGVVRVYAADRGGASAMHRIRNTIAGIANATAVAIAPGRRLLLVDGSQRAVHVLDESGSLLGSLGVPAGADVAAGEPTLGQPVAVHVDGQGKAYVADASRGCVQVYNATSLAHVATVGGNDLESGSDWLQRPADVAVDGRGRIYVADSEAHCVKVFDPITHALVGVVGTPGLAGTSDASLRSPSGVEIDRRGFLYVADTGNNRVQVFSPPSDLGSTEAIAPRSSAVSPPALWSLSASIPEVDWPVSVATYRDKAPPRCTLVGPAGGGEQSRPFQIQVRWSEPVDDRFGSQVGSGGGGGSGSGGVVIGGVGGTLGGTGHLSTNDSITFSATVVPAGIGTVVISVSPWSAVNYDGNGNPEGCGELRVEYMGGACASEMGCRWRLATHEHELALERTRTELELKASRDADLLRIQARAQRETEERQEAAREKAAEREHAMRVRAEREVAFARAEAEADARVREARETEGVRLREIGARGRERREQIVAAVDAVIRPLGKGFTDLLDDKARLGMLVGSAALLAVVVLTVRELSSAVARHLERVLGMPALVRETSRRGPLQSALERIFWWRRTRPARPSEIFQDVVLSSELSWRLRQLAAGVSNGRRRGAPLRHVLFHGPPGTGKTMAAERLAKTTGLEYAIISGGDVAPLGSAAVTQLHDLFDWAYRSKRGVLLFIDEADAFLRRRHVASAGASSGRAAPGLARGAGEAGMGEGMRAALTALLARTGRQSEHLMLVLASNRPEDLDAAILDRIDDVLEFPLPQAEQREALLSLYFNKYLPCTIPLTKGKATGGAVTGTPSPTSALGGGGPVPPNPPPSREHGGKKGERKGGAHGQSNGGGEKEGGGSGGARTPRGGPSEGAGEGKSFTAKERKVPPRKWWGSKRALQPVMVDGINESIFKKATQRTEGFSGRQLAKLMAAVQSIAYAQEGEGNAVLTANTFLDIVDAKAREHAQRIAFSSQSTTHSRRLEPTS